MKKSERTFVPEFRLLRSEVPDAFWESDYPPPHGSGRNVLGGLHDLRETDFSFKFWYPRGGVVRAVDQRRVFLDGSGQWREHSTTALHEVSSASKDEESFGQAFWRYFGVDIEELLQEYKPLWTNSHSNASSAIAALVETFGMDAFGAYLPFHAYFKSPMTPWGMYLFPEKLIEAAKWMHKDAVFLGADKCSCLTVLRRLWWMTYRHELFHFHVERFATKFEIAYRRPIYRPYVERVRIAVQGTDDWLEEALAQAVLLNSTLLQRMLGLRHWDVCKLLIPFLKIFPAGYENYEGKPHQSISAAHEYFAAQIIHTEINHSKSVTAMVTPLREYVEDKESVPGYLVLGKVASPLRFQLDAPRMDEVEEYCRSSVPDGDRLESGDRRIVIDNNERIEMNFDKVRKEIDFASIKALAHHRGMRVHELISEIRRK